MVSRYVSNFALGIGHGNPSGHPSSHVTPMPLGVAMAATAAAAAAAAQAATVPQSQQMTVATVAAQQQQSLQNQQQQSQQQQGLKGPPNEYHVQQCLVQGPPGGPHAQQHQHYRIIHSRSDGYVAAPAAGYSAPQSGAPHQAPPAVLRGMQSTATSTPPQQQDLNKMQQQPPMFVATGGSNSSGNVRPQQPQQQMFRATPTSSAPRGNSRQYNITMTQPMYSQQIAPVGVPAAYQPHRQPTSQLYAPTATPYQYTPQPFISNHFPSQYFYNPAPQMITSAAGGITVTAAAQHRGPNQITGGIVQATSQLGNHGAQQQQLLTASGVLTAAQQTQSVAGASVVTVGVQQTQPTNNNLTNRIRKPRKHAIDIIHPDTHKNVLEELNKSQAESDYQDSHMTTGSTEILLSSADVLSQQDLLEHQKPIPTMIYSASGEVAPHHKMNNDLIGSTTPIVSANTDAPSVEIHPKPQPKKKNKSIEIKPPPPSITTASDKSDDKSSNATDNSEKLVSTHVTNVPSSIGKTVEENRSNNKAINKQTEDFEQQTSSSIKSSVYNKSSNNQQSKINQSTTTTISSTPSIKSSSSSPVKQLNKETPTIIKPIITSTPPSTITTITTTTAATATTTVVTIGTNTVPLKLIDTQSQSIIQTTTTTTTVPPIISLHTPTTTILTQQQQQKQSSNKISSQTQTIPPSNQKQHVSTIPPTTQQQQLQTTLNSNLSSSSATTTTPSSKSALPITTTTASTLNQSDLSVTVLGVSQPAHGGQIQYKVNTIGLTLPSLPSNVNQLVSTSATNNLGKHNKNLQHHQNRHQQQKSNVKVGNQHSSNSGGGGVGGGSSNNNNNNNNVATAGNSATSTTTTKTTTSSILKSNDDKDKSMVTKELRTIISAGKQKNIFITKATTEILSNPIPISDIQKKSDKSDLNISTQSVITPIQTDKIGDKNNKINSTSSALSSPKDEIERSVKMDNVDIVNNNNLNKNNNTNDNNINNFNNNTNNINNNSNNNINSNNNNSKEQPLPTDDKVKEDEIFKDKILTRTKIEMLEIQDNVVVSSNTSYLNGVLTTKDLESNESKSNNESKQIIASKSLINYKEGQWSPENQYGSKTYDRNQLLTLREAPLSRAKPDIKAAYILLSNTNKSPQTSLMPLFVLNNSSRKNNNNVRGQSMSGIGNSISGGNNNNLISGAAGSGGMSGTASNSIGGNNIGNIGTSSCGNINNPFAKQSSMSGVNPKNNAKGSKSGMIHVSLSLREEIILNSSENAWRPTHIPNEQMTAEDRAREELKRKVRGILNKLTPEKFELLVEQIMKLQIDTADKVNEVMILVFEKAIDEPNFSVSYARLCQRLAYEVKAKDEKGAEGSKNLTLFRNALLDKTEREFTDNVTNRQAKEKKLQPILDRMNESQDMDKKQELKSQLEEEERKIRRRSGGTVRFIGELFKISMLTGNIIRQCIENLLDASSEDKLECLCKLLTTVGKKYELTPISSKDVNSRFYSLDNVIKKMQAISERKTADSSKISSRIRFMLQDVIDLRKNKWATARNDAPKTMEQIQKEAKTEQMSNQYMNYGNLLGTNSNKKDDNRRGGGSGYVSAGSGGNNSSSGGVNNVNSGGTMSFNSNSGSGGSNTSNNSVNNSYYNKNSRGGQQIQGEDTWYTQTSKGNRAVDTNKLGQMLNYDADTGTPKLGGISQFMWNHGAVGNNSARQPTATTSNSFAALSILESNKNSNSGPRNKGSYTKGSMERDRYDTGSAHGSRTGSAHGSRESSSSRNQSSARSASSSIGSSVTMQKSASQQNYNTTSSSTLTPPLSSRSSSKSMPANTINTTASSASTITASYPSAPPPATFDELDGCENDMTRSVTKMIEIAFEVNMIDDIIPILNDYPVTKRWGIFYVIFCEYLHLHKINQTHRKTAAKLTEFLIKNKFMSLEHFKKAYSQFISIVQEIIIDVPQVWQYIFQYVGPLIYKDIIQIRQLWNSEFKKTDDMGIKFIQNFILYFTKEIGPNYTKKLWRNSNFKWEEFMNEEDVKSFIENNKFQYIDSDVPYEVTGTQDTQKIIERVKELLEENVFIDDIFDYLRGNVTEIDKTFIRGLTAALCDHAIICTNKSYKLDQNRFQKTCIPILQRYIDSKDDRQLQCLYAIQLLINILEHPQGLLCDIFGELYEYDVIAQETLSIWKESKEEPSGKGVAVLALNPYLKDLFETSDDKN